MRDAARIYEGAPDRHLLNMAIFSLRGAARDYLSRHETDMSCFEDVLSLMENKYSNILDQIQLRNQLAELKQVKTVSHYNMEFDQLLLQIFPALDQIEELRLYTNGLRPSIRQAVLLANPSSLDQTMRLAAQVEESQRLARGAPFTRPPESTATTSAGRQVTISEGLKKLTPEEREQCMKAGLCLRCRKPGHQVRNCPLNGQGPLGKGQAQ